VLLKYRAYPAVAVHQAQSAIRRALSAKALDSKVWDEQDLTGNGLAVVLDYRTRFDTRLCASCPFGALRQGEHHRLCLNPSHYHDLQAAAVRAAEEAATRQREQAAGDDISSLPRITDLRHAERLDQSWSRVPPTCTEACPCRGRALDGEGKPAVVCLNRDRRDQLWREHMELQNAERARREAAQREALFQHLEILGDLGPRELTLLAAATLRAHQHEPTTALALRRLQAPGAHSTGLNKPMPSSLLTRKDRLLDDHLTLIQALAQLTPLEQLKAALAVLLAADIRTGSTTMRAAGTRYHWYMNNRNRTLTPAPGDQPQHPGATEPT
jgi:hypothetical protein